MALLEDSPPSIPPSPRPLCTCSAVSALTMLFLMDYCPLVNAGLAARLHSRGKRPRYRGAMSSITETAEDITPSLANNLWAPYQIMWVLGLRVVLLLLHTNHGEIWKFPKERHPLVLRCSRYPVLTGYKMENIYFLNKSCVHRQKRKVQYRVERRFMRVLWTPMR